MHRNIISIHVVTLEITEDSEVYSHYVDIRIHFLSV